jgi:hypothetical protein
MHLQCPIEIPVKTSDTPIKIVIFDKHSKKLHFHMLHLLAMPKPIHKS